MTTMPPKKKDKGGGVNTGDKRRDVFQAVVVADSFNFRFLPITRQQPRALLPLCNKPLIDYTLEFLITSGVEDIIVLCRAHANLVRDHIQKVKETHSTVRVNKVDINVVCVGENSSMSAGDCLRELERQQLIRSDFVLVSGDVVSNMNLKVVLDAHKERRRVSKSAVMTLVLKEAKPSHATRTREDDIVVAMESNTQRLVSFRHVSSKRKVPLLLPQGDLEIRDDLMDCHISICSPEVPQLFTDNFDYSCRDDFIEGALIHEEITGHQIHTFILDKDYAARVSNLQSYAAISKDVIHRWTYPVVPDVFMNSQNRREYSHKWRNIYIGNDVHLARDCTLEEDVVIGSGSSVGERSQLTNCVLGDRCIIGKDVQIDGAFLWDDVVIEDGCKLSKSIICSKANVQKGVTVNPGTILSYGVCVGPDVTLPAGIKVTFSRQRDARCSDSFSFDEDGVEKALAEQSESEVDESTILGEDCLGFIFVEKEDPDEPHLAEQWGLPETEAEKVTYWEEDEDSDEDDDDAENVDGEYDEAKHFFCEVLDSVQNAVKARINSENLILEINGSKHAYNMTIDEIPPILMKAVLLCGVPGPGETAPSAAKEGLTAALKHLKPVFEHYVRPQYHVTVIGEMENVCLRNKHVQPLFTYALHALYNYDVIEEEAILKWSESPLPSKEDNDDDDDVDYNVLREQSATLVKWLKTAEEESDEESDDDDDDEEEEEEEE